MQQQMVELNTHWLEKVNPSEHLAYDGNIHLEDGLIKEFKVGWMDLNQCCWAFACEFQFQIIKKKDFDYLSIYHDYNNYW